MKIVQSHIFEQKVKKLTPRQKSQLDDAIREILAEPTIGEPKKGDLSGVFVYKFHLDKALYLLAYTHSDTKIELIMLGPHENYYANLKGYLRKR